MKTHNSGKLGEFLREVSNWEWEQFVRAEHDPKYSSNQGIIFGLVRACSLQKLDAIKLSINRLDGKLKTPVKIEYPKFFYLYPNARLPEQKMYSDDPTEAKTHIPDTKSLVKVEKIEQGELIVPVAGSSTADDVNDLPSLSLRETLTRMSDYPRELPDQVVDLALQTEQWIKNGGPRPYEQPKVKSVMAANLLIMAKNRNMEAISEVFDQIDGKLVETIEVLGEDVYITSYAAEVPPEAYLNADGILQAEATQSQTHWQTKLGG